VADDFLGVSADREQNENLGCVNRADVTTALPLSHAEAMQLQAAELERTPELLRSLDAADWAAQTECPEWDVRRMYLHVLGHARRQPR